MCSLSIIIKMNTTNQHTPHSSLNQGTTTSWLDQELGIFTLAEVMLPLFPLTPRILLLLLKQWLDYLKSHRIYIIIISFWIIYFQTHDHSICIRPSLPPYDVQPQSATFQLKGSLVCDQTCLTSCKSLEMINTCCNFSSDTIYIFTCCFLVGKCEDPQHVDIKPLLQWYTFTVLHQGISSSGMYYVWLFYMWLPSADTT